MKDLFVPFDIAKTLKEKGFDENCFALFYKEQFKLADYVSMPYVKNSEMSNLIYTAPLWQQCLDWLRKDKGIHISITYTNIQKTKHYHVCLININDDITGLPSSVITILFDFNSYYSAIQSGIEKSL